MKSAALIFIFASMLSAPLLVCGEKAAAAEQKKQAILTEAEREILKDRELLENLELLKSLDKIQYLDLFAVQEQKKEENPAAPAKKKTERKK